MSTFTRWVSLAALLAFATGADSPTASAAGSSRKVGSSAVSSSSKSVKQKKSRKKRPSTRMRLPKGPTPARISEIQTALSRNGYFDGNPTGKWDAKTRAALQNFQSANNLDPTGKLNAPSLQKLGLGSDIAGVSAPKPVAPVYCCGAPASSAPPSPSASPSGSPVPAGRSSTVSPSPSTASN